MSKVKLNKVLFEYMESITNQNYNYLEFINDLGIVLHGCESQYLSEHDGEFKQCLIPENREETIEKLVKAFVFGYEEESDTYTIVLLEENGKEFVLWYTMGSYEIAKSDRYHEMDGFKKSFTMEEVVANFPQLVYLTRKNK
ncbi:hypothetical protein [Streptococcus phage D4446]|nr:hypothetical protein [Streptococcus phage D4446]